VKPPEPYRLDGVDRTTRVEFLTKVTELLAHGPFRRRRGRDAIIVWRDGEEPKITGRADWAGFLFANGMTEQGRECIKRRVPPGHVLCWLETDREDVASAGFALIDYASEVAGVMGEEAP
jgi:hypothetical protein